MLVAVGSRNHAVTSAEVSKLVVIEGMGWLKEHLHRVAVESGLNSGVRGGRLAGDEVERAVGR